MSHVWAIRTLVSKSKNEPQSALIYYLSTHFWVQSSEIANGLNTEYWLIFDSITKFKISKVVFKHSAIKYFYLMSFKFWCSRNSCNNKMLYDNHFKYHEILHSCIFFEEHSVLSVTFFCLFEKYLNMMAIL